MSSYPGRFLVQADRGSGKKLEQRTGYRLLVSDVSLSFWGGIDPNTGIVIDKSHPLHGRNVANTILCLPSGRGSCTASQVLLELILRGMAPKAIVLRDSDGLVCVGALIAQEIFQHEVIPDIVCIGEEGYTRLLEKTQCSSIPYTGMIDDRGNFLLRDPHLTIQDLAEDGDHVPSAVPVDLRFSAMENNLLETTSSDAEAMALRVIFQYARVLDEAPTYVPISGSHIDGCTYIGPGGLEFVRRLVAARGHVKVPTTLNSVSADRNRWKALGVPVEYAQNSIALGDAYLNLGCQPSFTCAPYLLPSAPAQGLDVAWGESNAVVFANSVLGARTEKYADYLDICCAITGIVPYVGVHRSENRKPKVILNAQDAMKTLLDDTLKLDLDLLFPVLGHLCGTLSDGRVPLLLGLEGQSISKDHLKAFCAAFGTTAASPLIHIAGITPEAKDDNAISNLINDHAIVVTKEITVEQLEQTYRELDSGKDHRNTGDEIPVDLIALGNPHLSVTECENLAKMADGKAKTRIIACMSRQVHSMANPLHLATLSTFGVEFVFDTCWCMLLDPPIIPNHPDAVILTNSGKYAHYGPGLVQRNFRMGSMADCMTAARTGMFPQRSQPQWLMTSRHQSFRTFATICRRLFLRR